MNSLFQTKKKKKCKQCSIQKLDISLLLYFHKSVFQKLPKKNSKILFHTMAKSKNHTNANQACKNHKNGMKRPAPLALYMSQRGSWLPNIKNTRKVRKNNQKAAIAARKARLAKTTAGFGKK
jgi:large subunit ribosomal protein L29e